MKARIERAVELIALGTRKHRVRDAYIIMPHDLEITVLPAPEVNGFKVDLSISGRSVFGEFDLIGLDPDDVLADLQLLPAESADRDVVIARCECGEVGCDSLTVNVSREGESIVWRRSSREPRRWPAAPITFDARQYWAEVRRAAADRTWETPDRTAARLLKSSVDHARLASRGLTFQWGSKYINEGCFTVSLGAEPGPYQVLVSVPTSGEPPEQLTERFVRLLRSDPAEWAYVEWIPQHSGDATEPKQAGRQWRRRVH